MRIAYGKNDSLRCPRIDDLGRARESPRSGAVCARSDPVGSPTRCQAGRRKEVEQETTTSLFYRWNCPNDGGRLRISLTILCMF